MSNLIKHNFGCAAAFYDKYALIQKQVAMDLSAFLRKTQGAGAVPEQILEIGCGTGIYTQLLSNLFPMAQITAVDISAQMLAQAQHKVSRNCRYLHADAQHLNLPDRFDLLTSNASFQWLNNLSAAFQTYQTLLKPQGIICFSMFGPDTFCELDACLKTLDPQAEVSAKKFHTQAQLQQLVSQYFQYVIITEQRYQKVYPSLKSLFQTIKNTGVRGQKFQPRTIMTPHFFHQLEETYLAHHQQISVTYQVFFAKAGKLI